MSTISLRKFRKWVFPIIRLLILYFKLRFIKRDKDRILLIPEFSNFGGTRTYFFSLLNFFYENNRRVSVLLSEGQQDSQVLEKIKLYNFTVITNEFDFGIISYNPKILSKFNINPLKKTVHALIHYLKIIYNNRPKEIVISVGTAEKFLFFFCMPIKIVYIIHTVVETPISKIQMLWLKRKKKYKIITVSNFSRNQLKEFWFKNKETSRLEYIYNYFPEVETADHKKDNNRVVILTIGTVVDYKNPPFWLNVARKITSKFPNVYFYWVGGGPELEHYKHAASNYNRIEFVGFHEDVRPWYSKADIYFQPSLKESFGLSVAGAMAYGLGIIVSNREALPEIITTCENGIVVDIENQKEVLLSFNKLIIENEFRNQIGNKAREKFYEKFSFQSWFCNMQETIIN